MLEKLRLAERQKTCKVEDKLRVLTMSTQEEEPERRRGFRTVIMGLLGAAIASLCCLPLIIIALGTVGGLGLIMGLAAYGVPLTLLVVGLFLIGIYQYRRIRKRKLCAT